MFLFKTSGRTLDSVVKNQKHAFPNKPRDWHVGELVLVSKNRADCKPGEQQIQFLMVLESIRLLNPGESEKYWPSTDGRWHYLVECKNTIRIHQPFDLKIALGDTATKYGPPQGFVHLSPEHENQLVAFLRHREPGFSL